MSAEGLGASPPTSPTCLSDLDLDVMVAGGRASAAVTAHLVACPRCQARREDFAAAREHAAATVTRLQRLAQARVSQPARGGRWRRWMVIFGGVATAAAALVLIATFAGGGLVLAPPGAELGGDPGIRMKGVNVKFFRWRDGKVTPGVSGDTFRAGDALRFAVTSAAPSQVLLVGVDAAGAMRAYFPFDGAASAALPAGVDVPLPGSLVLDGARGTEYYVTLILPAQLALSDVRAAFGRARAESADVPTALAHLRVPGSRTIIVVRKE